MKNFHKERCKTKVRLQPDLSSITAGFFFSDLFTPSVKILLLNFSCLNPTEALLGSLIERVELAADKQVIRRFRCREPAQTGA